MKNYKVKLVLIFLLVLGVLSLDLEFANFPDKSLVSTADAVVGRPASPVSYAGVARRSPVGVNRAGNRGGPVNRVGRR